jgi:hypothetical protein
MTAGLPILSEVDRRTLDAYLALPQDRPGANPASVRVFGSVAPGERWWPGMPIHSHLDLLVLVREPLQPALQQESLDATYPLFLESGRQLGPQFRTPEQLAASPIREVIERDGVELPLP